MILHLFFLFIYISLGGVLSPSAMLMVAIAESCMAIYVKVRDTKYFILPYIITLATLLTVNIGNLSLIDRVENKADLMYIFTVPEYIPDAVMIWCVGCSIFFLGYTFFEKRSMPSVAVNITPKQSNVIFYIMLGFLVFAPWIFPLLSFLGNFAKIFGLLANVGVLFFAKLWASTDNKKYRNYAIVLLVLQTYNGIFHSYLRYEIIIPTIVFSIGYFAGKRNISYLLSYRTLPLIVVLGLFFNGFTQLEAYRSNFAVGIQNIYFGGSDEEEDAPLEAYTTTKDRGGAFDRASTIGQITAILKLVNTNGFYGGLASEPLVAALVPRILWPEKPRIAIGQWFAIETGTAYVREGETKANNSVNMTVPGELYLDFGWVGLAIGCFLFGGFFVTLWNSSQFYISNYNLTGAIWGGYILLNSLAGISGDLQISITLLSFYIIFVVIKRLCGQFV
ncbi:hypothetical protein CJD36_009510 [Flavipsychrobacter stenotrophus]|uniref:Oligosaccharide repeat unit polymerase n=1 Tax=Flavipsychrobacter stenotrophus TaxID=2077091 RepID=A0A2S7SZM2_9BACT|nr:hypothetical protein [Flavipsychrobacter stenotrophus]PQJ12015.1 hypothetical protein CJD36_009510 [Flavipsychrobacter stenotrophus]